MFTEYEAMLKLHCLLKMYVIRCICWYCYVFFKQSDIILYSLFKENNP